MSITDLTAVLAVLLTGGVLLFVLGILARASRRRAGASGGSDGSVFAITTLAGDGGGHCSSGDGGGGCDGGGGS